MSARIRVLIVRPSTSPFIEADIEILRKHFDVRTVDVFEKGRSLGNSVKVFMRLLRGVLWADVAYSWFAEIYALWAVRLSRFMLRKSIVVVGGYEVACLPDIGYGKLIDPKEARQVRYTLDHASTVLTVSNCLKREAVENAGARGDNILTLPTGFDPELFSPSGEKDTMVMTAAICGEARRVKVKGIDVFVEVARKVPHASFEVVGMADNVRGELRRPLPENLKLLPPLSQEVIVGHYRKAKVYCQLSMREGLPNALCEAMLCGCVPVVSDVGAMSEAVGETGFVVHREDLDEVVDAVMRALVSDSGKAARQRVIDFYSRARREEALVSIINGLVPKKNKHVD
jgi:glycosyltransferase involved in cell wall biosynthesis